MSKNKYFKVGGLFEKVFNILTKLFIIALFIYTWRLVQVEGSSLNEFYIYLYLFLVIWSLLSDRYFYKGQNSENKKEHEMTIYYLSLMWFVTLIIPIAEYVYITRYNFYLTILVMEKTKRIIPKVW